MGRRSRKPRPVATPPPERSAMYARSEARNAVLRERLAPLGPGEHPLALRIAIVVAIAVGVANVALWALGWEVRGQDPGLGGALVPALVMGLAAWGMWQQRYWAVLGFQALLGIVILFASAGLVVASNLLAAVLALLVIGLSGWLFWRLVRVLGRMQAPRAPR